MMPLPEKEALIALLGRAALKGWKRGRRNEDCGFREIALALVDEYQARLAGPVPTTTKGSDHV